jgi:tetratricopeptide (TPR) repeat protein
MEKFTLALSTIKMAHKRGFPKSAFVFESAYCLYRLGKFLSALNLIEKSKLDSRLNLLKGQILYRLERFEEADEIFNNLIKTDEFSNQDLQVNLLAAKAQAGINSYEKVDSYDSAYNLALVKFANNEFKATEQLVNECEKFLELESVSQSDSINLKLISICAMMGEKTNWPEAEFLLRKLKTFNG